LCCFAGLVCSVMNLLFIFIIPSAIQITFIFASSTFFFLVLLCILTLFAPWLIAFSFLTMLSQVLFVDIWCVLCSVRYLFRGIDFLNLHRPFSNYFLSGEFVLAFWIQPHLNLCSQFYLCAFVELFLHAIIIKFLGELFWLSCHNLFFSR